MAPVSRPVNSGTGLETVWRPVPQEFNRRVHDDAKHRKCTRAPPRALPMLRIVVHPTVELLWHGSPDGLQTSAGIHRSGDRCHKSLKFTVSCSFDPLESFSAACCPAKIPWL